MIQMYKIMNSVDDLDCNRFFTPTPIQCTRNSDNKVFITYSRTNLRKNCFTNRCAPHWNRLKSSTKHAVTLNNFKILLDGEQYFKDNFYAFDE